jgi:hypothetical protein
MCLLLGHKETIFKSIFIYNVYVATKLLYYASGFTSPMNPSHQLLQNYYKFFLFC